MAATRRVCREAVVGKGMGKGVAGGDEAAIVDRLLIIRLSW
jgi:hypothetical protein